jgi:uncharacterized protein YjbJ (UPF0337 family)
LFAYEWPFANTPQSRESAYSERQFLHPGQQELHLPAGASAFPAYLRIHSALVPNLLMTNVRRKQMSPSSKDQIKGKFHEVKGKAKQTAGQVTDNPKLEAEGQAEKLTGKIQKKVGQVEKVFEK